MNRLPARPAAPTDGPPRWKMTANSIRGWFQTRCRAKSTGLFAFNLFPFCLVLFCFYSVHGQNIVDASSTSTLTANPVALTDTEVSEFFWLTPDLQAAAHSPAHRVAEQLDTHVRLFLDGAPWKPFHHTLGISGYEVNFGHPDEMFLSLSLAMPTLPESTARHLSQFLQAQLEASPPFVREGFDYRAGHAREPYDVPESLRRQGRAPAIHALGLYSLWVYVRYAGNTTAARALWPAARDRGAALLDKDYVFDVRRQSYSRSEAEILNGDLAGLLGLARLARLNGDPATEQRAVRRGRQLLELRVNLDRVNPRLLEKSADATKGLHNYKLARYCALVPEVAEAVRRHSAGCAAARLESFRTERNGWYMAFGDRLIGGENYTNPLHLPRALFADTVFIERLPGDQLVSFLDVPWCPGDFYFIEKCTFALWATIGRPWKAL